MFTIPVKLESGNTFHLKEVSLTHYKNFCKGFNFHVDAESIRAALDEFLDECLTCSQAVDLNLIEKILVLLKIRSLILGNNVVWKFEKFERVFNIVQIYNALNKPIPPYFEYNTLKYGPPKNFIITSVDMVMNAKTSMIEAKNNFSALPFQAIFDKQKETYKDLSFSLPMSDDNTLELSIFDTSFLSLFKAILSQNLNDIMEMEYILRKEIGFTSYDFEKVPYIECNIILNRIIKENKDKNDKMDRDPLKIK